MSKAGSVYSILKLQLFIAKIFGLAPFNITNNGPEDSKIAQLWNVILMIALTALSLFALISRGHREYGLIMKIGDALSVYLNIISMCCVLVYSCIYNRTIMDEIRKMFHIDTELQKFNFIADIHRSYNKSKSWVVFGTSLVMFYVTALLIVNIVTYGPILSVVFIGNVVAYIFPSIINVMMEMQFCTMVLLLRRRFCWLNNKILEITNILKKPYTDEPLKLLNTKTSHKYTNQDQVTLLIGQVKVSHQQLCTISKRINKAFSVQILLLIVTTFLNSVMTLFYWAIRSTLTTKDELSKADKIFMSNGFALAVVEVIFIVLVCSATASEAKRTGSLIHDMMPPADVLPNKRALQLQLSSFSLQLAQYNVEFNACGVFPINETLIYSIVGAASAYLVIVIQFELSNRASNHTMYNST